MNKIFHVFVSSTYSDLIEERKKVSEAVSKAGFVAEGMEIFPASSQKQMSFIERVIDRCDYYILILAGRYGSVAEDGLSYTEKEFQYAKSRDIPVLAFIRDDLGELPINLLEEGQEGKDKLATFIERLKADTLVDFWTNPDELSMKALAALSQARGSSEGVGWIRGDVAASTDILNEINTLRKENEELKARIADVDLQPIFDDVPLAGLDEEFKIHFEVDMGYSFKRESALLTWRAILAAIGPQYRAPSTTLGISNSRLELLIKKAAHLSSEISIDIEIEDKRQILIQMEALGIMTAEAVNLTTGGHATFYQLTSKGLAQMLRENVVRSEKVSDS